MTFIARDIIVIAAPAKDMTTLEIQGSLEHVLKIAKSSIKRLNRVGCLLTLTEVLPKENKRKTNLQ